jgi:hypothetical protein
MSIKRDSPQKDTNINVDQKDDIDVVDSNVNIESTEERPGVGYEILGIGIGNGIGK